MQEGHRDCGWLCNYIVRRRCKSCCAETCVLLQRFVAAFALPGPASMWLILVALLWIADNAMMFPRYHLAGWQARLAVGRGREYKAAVLHALRAANVLSSCC